MKKVKQLNSSRLLVLSLFFSAILLFSLTARSEDTNPALVTNAATGSISGFCFNDENENGIMDEGEQPVAGMTITLTKLTMFLFPIELGTAVTDEQGAYTFSNLRVSIYRVKAQSGSEAQCTTRNPVLTFIGFVNKTREVNFGYVVSGPTTTTTISSTTTSQPTSTTSVATTTTSVATTTTTTSGGGGGGGGGGTRTTTTTVQPTTTTSQPTTSTSSSTTTVQPTTTTTTINLRFTDNGNGTVTDTLTGLFWLRNANPWGVMNWADATSACASLASGSAGLSDGSVAGQWRLPSKEELEGIGTDPPATWESGSPSVPWTTPGAPFTAVQSWDYWSSTEYADSPDFAWNVDMSIGGVYINYKSYSSYCVWPVRSGN